MVTIFWGAIGAAVFLGLIALDPNSPHARANLFGCARGIVCWALVLTLLWFAPTWARALLAAI